MSDPLREAQADKRAANRDRIRHEYTPIVLWVKGDKEEVREMRTWVRDELASLPATVVATSNEPYPYAADGVLRIEDADSGDA